METGFLNFHDGENFSDFSLSLDHQHNLLGESEGVLDQMIDINQDNDFDYIDNINLSSQEALWETEQEFNCDLAVLPAPGISTIMPKMDNMKEDFAKVLTDWQEHLGYLQATEIEEDIDLINLDLGMQMSSELQNDIFESENEEKLIENSKEEDKLPDNIANDNPDEVKIDGSVDYSDDHSSESDDIDVVGLDSIDEVESPRFNLMHENKQQVVNYVVHNVRPTTKVLDKKTNIKQESSENVLECFATDNQKVGKIIIKKKVIEASKNKSSKKKNKHQKVPSIKIQKIENTLEKSKKQDKNVRKQENSVKKEIVLPKVNNDIKKEEVVSDCKSSVKVLEAGDVRSLLEQFEASELTSNSSKQSTNIHFAKKISQVTSNKPHMPIVKNNRDSSKINQNIKDSLPKEVIDRIKASGQRKGKSILLDAPIIKKVQSMSEYKSKVTNNMATDLHKKKPHSKDKTEGSIQLDHDYCNNSNSGLSSSDSNSEYDRQFSDNEINTQHKKQKPKENNFYSFEKTIHTNIKFSKKQNIEKKSKKDSGLESSDVSDACEEALGTVLFSASKSNKNSAVNDLKPAASKNPINQQKVPNCEMKIQSALATSIIQLRKGVLTKTAQFCGAPVRKQQMVSVLKNPPSATHPQNVIPNYRQKYKVTANDCAKNITKCEVIEDKEIHSFKENEKKPIKINSLEENEKELKECITSDENEKNSLEISPLEESGKNSIDSNNSEENEKKPIENNVPEENEKKPPRKKLNLAEYRSRREQNRSDGSRTTSPIQPMTLVYVHHISTTTEPILDDPENPVWSEREIISILKPKSEVEQAVNKPKQPMVDIGVQTNESVFEHSKSKYSIETKENAADNSEKCVNVNIVDKADKNSSVIVIDDTVNNDDDTNNGLGSCGEEKNAEMDVKLADAAQFPRRNKDRIPRSYRRTQSSSSLSSSSSRSASKSRSKNRKRSKSRSRNKRNRSITPRSRRARSRRRRQNDSSPSSSAGSFDRSRSRSRSLSRRRFHKRRRKISRRSSISSSSSWYSRSLSRSRSRSTTRYRSSSISRSRSSRSRSRSPYSTISRCSSRSNYGRSNRSSRRFKERWEQRSNSVCRNRRYSSDSYHGSRRRSPYGRSYEFYDKEKQRQVEERRVVYVGHLTEDVTKTDLARRFGIFGPIVDISLHFRDRGNHYGFVTFAYKTDAYEAVEHGNDDPTLPRYDLCFGGRRAFCKTQYSDLDGMGNNAMIGGYGPPNLYHQPEEENTFDLLLKEAQAKLRKRKA